MLELVQSLSTYMWILQSHYSSACVVEMDRLNLYENHTLNAQYDTMVLIYTFGRKILQKK